MKIIITIILLTSIHIQMLFCSAQSEILKKEHTEEQNDIPEEENKVENGNPRPVAISIFCSWGCNVGYRVCKFQKRESIELKGKCDATLDMCVRKCENSN